MSYDITQHTARQMLESRLNSWATAGIPAVPIAWENDAFEPPTNGAYARAYLLPAATNDPSLGMAHRRYSGTFQINVFCPKGEGPDAAQVLAEEIEALYPRGLAINGVRITKTPEIGRGTPDGNWYMVPVFVTYRLDAFS